jgi:3-oxoacyl-(acyl-carrier-protein) synthase
MISQEIWISGAGIVSAIGEGIDIHLDALRNAKSGLTSQSFFNGALPDPCMTGKVPLSVIEKTIDQTAKDRAIILAEKAFTQSVAQSKLPSFENTDLVIGTTLGNMHGGTMYYHAFKQNENPQTDLVKYVMPDAVGNYLSKKYEIRGKHITVSSACASGTTAIGTALNRIKRNHCEIAIACGVDALSPFVIAGFNSLRLLSKKECRPFSVSRDGLNPGEGAACVVLEKSESVIKRGVTPLAKITGYGTALEAFHYTKSHPEGKGIALAIGKALDRACLRPSQIDHIHAHGTATVFNDLSEYHGYLNVFGERLSQISVCSTKSMTGHTFGAAGAIAVILAVTTINNNLIPATLFCGQKDPLFSQLSVSNKPIEKNVKRVLCVALGFGGEVAALVVEAV